MRAVKLFVGAIYMSVIFVPMARATAQEIMATIDIDCDCTEAYRFVELDLINGKDLEPSDAKWELIRFYPVIDMTKADEPTVCRVEMEPSNRSYDGPNVPDGDYALFADGQWQLGSQYETGLTDTDCN